MRSIVKNIYPLVIIIQGGSEFWQTDELCCVDVLELRNLKVMNALENISLILKPSYLVIWYFSQFVYLVFL